MMYLLFLCITYVFSCQNNLTPQGSENVYLKSPLLMAEIEIVNKNYENAYETYTTILKSNVPIGYTDFNNYKSLSNYLHKEICFLKHNQKMDSIKESKSKRFAFSIDSLVNIDQLVRETGNRKTISEVDSINSIAYTELIVKYFYPNYKNCFYFLDESERADLNRNIHLLNLHFAAVDNNRLMDVLGKKRLQNEIPLRDFLQFSNSKYFGDIKYEVSLISGNESYFFRDVNKIDQNNKIKIDEMREYMGYYSIEEQIELEKEIITNRVPFSFSLTTSSRWKYADLSDEQILEFGYYEYFHSDSKQR